jgi:hypothetical protein
MAPASRSHRALVVFVAASLTLAVAALVGFAVLLPVVVRVRPAPGPVERAPRAAEVRAALRRAAAALRAGDRAAYDAALPASGRDARQAVAELYRHLAELPWTSLRLSADPMPGHPGRYDVRAAGEVGGAVPTDRIMADRVLETGVLRGRVVVVGDVTPRGVADQYVMAFSRPVVVRGAGVIVIADRRERATADVLARAGREARRRLALLGIRSRAPVVVYCYDSHRELRRALGGGPADARIRFFSRSPDRLGGKETWMRDVGVLGPALKGKEAWAPMMLAHELTHAYTARWFAHAKHAPTFLAEGLATAVEGGRSYQPLRADLAASASAYPIEDALAAGSLWQGNPTGRVRLAYLEGGSLVLYILDRWGLADLRAFVTAVSDSDLSRAGLDHASRASLGVGWRKLRAGWAAFVQTLP